MKVPKYSKHKATGQAYVTVDKKRHYLGKHGTPESEERYRRFLQQYSSAPANPRVIDKAPGAEIEVVELCGAYWLHAETYYDNSPESLDRIAAELGLSARSLRQLSVGWLSGRRAWSFPMRNAAGEIRGIRLRYPNGKKLAVRGGKEGLFLPADLQRAAGS